MRRLLTLLLVTFTALILELALIRWVAGQVRIVAYFPNLVLIAAFFGMGLGCLRQGKRSLHGLLPLGLLVLVLLAWGGSRIAFTGREASEYFWLLYYNLPEDAPTVDNLLLPLWLVFVFTTLVFIPIGQRVADLLSECQSEDRTLLGYAFDLGGSLLGVIAFTLLSLGKTFPQTWFAVALLAGLGVGGWHVKRVALYLASAALILVVVHRAEYADMYSPYYALNSEAFSDPLYPESSSMFKVSTNGSLHQVMISVTRSVPTSLPDVQTVRDGFNKPFSYLRRVPGNSLVLGAGTGNDVAVLLDNGVTNIDAVEIDPAILDMGKRLHPDAPYASSGVKAYVDDARSFLNNTDTRYDLIIFGTLDSMTRLSALSNVRLDNFVYTRESLEAAKRLLSDEGGLILHFMVGEEFIDSKIIALIADVFDEYPIIHDKHHNLFNRSYMVGPAFAHVSAEQREETLAFYKELTAKAPIEYPTDDWPYLYLEGRSVGTFYIQTLLMILVTAIGFLFILTLDQRKERPVFRSLDLPMFLFGAAFLILNTKSVTEIGLLWGNTWMTNSITFASILFVLLVSTLVFAYRPLPLKVCFLALFLSLVGLYLFPLSALLALPAGLKLICTVAFVGLPFFFAGACFAGVFKLSRDVPAALGWNVIGALCGGLLEYINMLLGFKALYLIALVFYLIAFLLFERKRNHSIMAIQGR
jgi:hypothetical protein